MIYRLTVGLIEFVGRGRDGQREGEAITRLEDHGITTRVLNDFVSVYRDRPQYAGLDRSDTFASNCAKFLGYASLANRSDLGVWSFRGLKGKVSPTMSLRDTEWPKFVYVY